MGGPKPIESRGTVAKLSWKSGPNPSPQIHLALPEIKQWYGNECQLESLNAREPDETIKVEAGTIERWNPNNDQFRCAGVAVVRKTIERNGLLLPEYTNADQLFYVVQGSGITGVLMPGCAETYQESQQQGGRFQDQHQKIRRYREGDVIALPAGTAHWCYNDGDTPLIVVNFLDISNIANQLDKFPRKFHLAGNPQKEHRSLHKNMQEQGQSLKQSYYGSSRSQECSNVFCGFDTRMLADAFNVDESIVRKLQSQNDERGSIVKVKGDELKVLSPPRTREQELREESRPHGRDNGIEETMCTMRLQENIGDPERADIYSPRVGRISTLNSNNLPILRWLHLSAERGVLYRNGMMVPHWNQNAHSIMYALRGSARIQVVDNFGRTVFDDRVQKGQILTIPQNYAVVKRAESEGFEWVSFKTNDNAIISPLAGKTSAIRAMPEEVVANAFRVTREEARKIKFNVQETTLTTSSDRRAAA
ncbi:hypothetical protein ACFE04_006011 [Oxalis oulophora]